MTSRSLTGQPDRGDGRARIGQAFPSDVERGAVVGAGPHDRQPERDIHAFVEVQRLQRNQGLIVIHAQRSIIAFACAGREQRIGRMRATGVDPLVAQCGDCRRDRRDLLGPEATVFACVRVEPCNCETRLRDSEIALQRRSDDARAAHDQVSSEHVRHIGERDMYGDRHRPQLRPGQHHHRVGGGDPAGGCDEFGLTRMVEPDLGEACLGDRTGDERGCVVRGR